jgi:hypothetical protein
VHEDEDVHEYEYEDEAGSLLRWALRRRARTLW